MKRDRQILAFAFSSCVLFVLFVGQVYAADNLVGGGGFGAKCEFTSNGKICSCAPPKTSTDCARLLNDCKNVSVPVKPWRDDLGHEHTHQWVPDVTCTKTECVCEVTSKTTGRFTKPAIIQNQVVAPSPKPATNPARLTRYKYMKSVVAKPTEGGEEEEEPQPRAVSPASKKPTVKVERR